VLISRWALKDLNLRPKDYESSALTAELRAQAVLLQRVRGTVNVPAARGVVEAVATLCIDTSSADFLCIVPFILSRRLKASSTVSGEGCTERCDAVTELCPAIFMIVNASAPDSLRRVQTRDDIFMRALESDQARMGPALRLMARLANQGPH
jgi:hypothetical protein